MNKRHKFNVTVYFLSTVFFVLMGYAVMVLNYSALAYLLFIIISGFCSVGLEKFFYVKYRNDEEPLPKIEFCFYANALPFMTLLLVCGLIALSSLNADFIAAVCLTAFGTLIYRFLYTAIEEHIFK